MFFALFLSAFPAVAADVTIREPAPFAIIDPVGRETMEGVTLGASRWEVSPAFHIHVSGPIEAGDADKLETAFFGVAQGLPFHNGILSLDSPGGNFEEALKLGDFIYSLSLPTYVFSGDTCLSACAIAFAAGSDEAIRGIYKTPARFAEFGADLGFHAPFLPEAAMRRAAEEEMAKDGSPVDNAMAFASDMFTVARDLTRQINDRAERWGLAPSLISEFLGYGPQEFYRIDTLSKARRSDVTMIARQVGYPTVLTWPDALEVCRFRLYASLSEFYDEKPGFVMGPGDRDASRAEPVPFPHDFARIAAGPLGSDAAIRRGPQRIEIDTFIPGRGNYTCRISQAPDARWFVDLEGDFHRDRAFGGNLMQQGPVEVNEVLLAGASGPRTEAAFDLAIREYVADRLRIRFPDEFGEAEMKPSYSCDGALTRAEALICETPTLAHLDFVMGREFGRAFKKNPAARDSQRDWFTARRDVCQTDMAEMQFEIARVNQLRCLAGAMIAQIEVLKEGRFD